MSESVLHTSGCFLDTSAKKLLSLVLYRCSLAQIAHAALWILPNTPSFGRIEKRMPVYYTCFPNKHRFLTLHVVSRINRFIINMHQWSIRQGRGCLQHPRQEHIIHSFRKLVPSPSLCYSLTHVHRSICYRNQTQPLAEDATRLMYLRVYDSQDSSRKSSHPTRPYTPRSLSHTQVHWLSPPNPVYLLLNPSRD